MSSTPAVEATVRRKRSIVTGGEADVNNVTSRPKTRGPAGDVVKMMTLVAFARKHKLTITPADLVYHHIDLRDLCLARGVQPNEVNDHRFGKVVTFPDWVLREHFGVK
jgi:hypothetical protein